MRPRVFLSIVIMVMSLAVLPAVADTLDDDPTLAVVKWDTSPVGTTTFVAGPTGPFPVTMTNANFNFVNNTGLAITSITFTETFDTVTNPANITCGASGVGFASNAKYSDSTAVTGTCVATAVDTGTTNGSGKELYTAQFVFSGFGPAWSDSGLGLTFSPNGFAAAGGTWDVSYTLAPEPSSFVLLGSGFLGVGGLLRRKFRR